MAIWEKFRWAIGLHSQEVGELSAVHRKNAGAGGRSQPQPPCKPW